MAMQQGGNSDSFPPVVVANHAKETLGINDLGGAMLRLTFVLCSGLFLALLIGGRDFGQLRPGLAQAEAEAKATPVTAEVPVVETVALVSDAPAAAPVVVAAVVAEPVVDAVPVSAVAQAVPEPVQTEPENNVFTLSSYADPVPESAPIAAEQPAEGEVWYVAGNSLNVRSGPSTDDDVVGKLARGEATLVVWREGEDWARIRIEGDGIEGYVAMRFLSPNVPVVN
jgi:Bacterial SH3 domain